MTTSTQVTSGKVAAAFALALFADAIQPVLTGMSLTGVLTVPTELLDLALDVALCVALSALLGGFHWVLLPAFLAELVPFVDVLPTWTAAVAALVWIRSQNAARARASSAARPAVQVLPASRRDVDRIVPTSFSVLEGKEEA